MEITTREEFEKLKGRPFFKGSVVTDSMEPLIKVGDKITVEVGNTGLKRFDIIIFYSDGKLICHYLWSMNKVFRPILLQTRNLKNGGKDMPISFDDYLGKVVSHKISGRNKTKIIFQKIFSGR